MGNIIQFPGSAPRAVANPANSKAADNLRARYAHLFDCRAKTASPEADEAATHAQELRKRLRAPFRGDRLVEPACERGCAVCYRACAVTRIKLDWWERELAAINREAM